MRILTWHVHGSYLYYLTSRSRHTFYLLVGDNRSSGRGKVFPFGNNVVDVRIDELSLADYDCVLYQTKANFETGERLIAEQRHSIPQIYLEHDPPLELPCGQLHPAVGSGVTIVHVTPFNRLMWDCVDEQVTTIDHGVSLMQPASANCSVSRGVTAVNNVLTRGSRVGADILAEVRSAGIDLDLVGINSIEAGGKGEVSPPDLPLFLSNYRFYFNPCRYTSLNLAVIEAMAVGLPIVGLATTEMATVITNGVNGFIDTDPEKLIAPMMRLTKDKQLALELGRNARRTVEQRFAIERFTKDWDRIFETANRADLSVASSVAT